MRRSLLAVVPAAVAIAIAGCGGGNNHSTSAPAGANAGTTAQPAAGTVRAATTKLGRILVDSHGRPLYYYAGDQKPGDTTGEGLNQFGAPWDVLSTSGKGIDND